jgi:hydrogenase nickel incorporation protein HypA/HybF
VTVRVGVNGFDRIGRNFFRFFRSLDAQKVLGQNTELELEANAAEVVCWPCDHRSEITSGRAARCPQCNGGDVEVVHGKEFLAASLDVSRKVLTAGRFHRHDDAGAHRHGDEQGHDHAGYGSGSQRVNGLESIFAEHDVRADVSRIELDLNGIHTQSDERR